ncbi:MAG: hypothetical protein HN579_02385, partial [Gammaproteobacteria bacterium]|nr:hypothetical protein [Gammaproteobacteria bacterium]
MSQREIQSEPVTASRLSQAQISQWREQGYTLVNGLITPALQQQLLDLADATFPAPGSAAADEGTDFGSNGALGFPSPHTIFNEITLDAVLLQAVADLLGTEVAQLRITQSDLWPKYGRPERQSERDNRDQRMHVDYPNHSLVHPPRWETPEAVELILYYSDAADCGGETAVVPRTGPQDPAYRWPIIDAPGIGDLRFINDRVAAETYLSAVAPEVAEFRAALYEREARVAYRPGDVLLYRHDTWHRGTPLKQGARRLAHNMTFRVAAAEWVSTLHPGWAWSAYRESQFLERWIGRASVLQRCVMGFPAPGNAYWNPETLAAVTARYGVFGFDPAPYALDS